MNTEHGFIRWPMHGFRDTGEGGLSCYAVWLDTENEVCVSGAQAWITGDVVFWKEEDLVAIPVDDIPEEFHPVQTRVRLTFEGDGFYMDTVPCTGFVYLGSTRRALAAIDEDGELAGGYFEPTMLDVTDEGRVLLRMLSDHYGGEPELLVFLDT